MQNVLDEMRYKIELRYQGKGEPKEFQIVDNENRLSYVTLPALGGKRKSGKSEYFNILRFLPPSRRSIGAS